MKILGWNFNYIPPGDPVSVLNSSVLNYMNDGLIEKLFFINETLSPNSQNI